jgi:hypothetical protein
MIDLSKTIEAKSDHLSADDLLGGSLTITISKVSVVNGDRPVVIEYVGGNGKPFLPCKSMRRVIVEAWGTDGVKYVGQSLTLYNDKTVRFGGQEVGGIRISHITGIDKTLRLPLSVARGKKAIFTVEPLNIAVPVIDVPLKDILIEISNAQSVDNLKDIAKQHSRHAEIESIKKALTARKEFLLTPQPQNIETQEF